MANRESSPQPETAFIGGFDTVRVTRKQLAEIMAHESDIARSTPEWLPSLVFSSNGQGISLAANDADFAESMSRATYIHADGMPVVIASHLTATPLPERIATTDFFHDAAKIAVERGLRFFMLGGSEKQNSEAVAQIRKLYPDLQIAGRRNGYFPESADGEVCQEIRESGADVVWVALGKPRQEIWSARNRHRLTGVGWVKTCGGLYAFLAGDSPRAPRWMQQLGLEWFYRAAREPKRLGWRYLTTNPHALYRLIRYTKRTHASRATPAA